MIEGVTTMSYEIVCQTNRISGCAGDGHDFVRISGDQVSDEVHNTHNQRPVMAKADAGNFEVYSMAGGYHPDLVAEAESFIQITVSSSIELYFDLAIDGATAATETYSKISLIRSSDNHELLSKELWNDIIPTGSPADWTSGYSFSEEYQAALEPNIKYILYLYSKTTSSGDSWYNRTRVDISSTSSSSLSPPGNFTIG